MNLGAHISIAGGIHLALHRGVEQTCRVVQVFVKNQMQWAAKPLQQSEIQAFRRAKKQTGIKTVIAHDTYLINLASMSDALWKRSIEAFHLEMERCEALGIHGLVTHPGSHGGAGEDSGLGRVAQALDVLHRRTSGYRVRVLLETTAGQGTNLGWRFEHLRAILDRVQTPQRLGLCVDTCHIFAAGYDIREEAACRTTFEELDGIVGVERIEAFHLNDSKRELGSRVDRHAHIGRGKIGLAGFSFLLRDGRFSRIPMFLETPKEGNMDRRNLRTLRALRLARSGEREAGRRE
ncbi:MAG: deoxyribonuclease IV [Planctomycetes bacterium]|nr:deoxyribonuclease IV [Planctomycetota bacterium]